eukprot:UC4_evm7s135
MPPSTSTIASMPSDDSSAEELRHWYTEANRYWGSVEPTVSGMLGGFASVSSVDVQESKAFINRLKSMGYFVSTNDIGGTRAIDCGAGIGRVAKKLLLRCFDSVDLIEQQKKFVDEAPAYIESDRMGKFICCGLQDWNPEPNRYDLIWTQWCVGHLTDEHLINFLDRCGKSLRPYGLVTVKENIAPPHIERHIVDEEDKSVTRTEAEFKRIFSLAGLTLVDEIFQQDFPIGTWILLFPDGVLPGCGFTNQVAYAGDVAVNPMYPRTMAVPGALGNVSKIVINRVKAHQHRICRIDTAHHSFASKKL